MLVVDDQVKHRVERQEPFRGVGRQRRGEMHDPFDDDVLSEDCECLLEDVPSSINDSAIDVCVSASVGARAVATRRLLVIASCQENVCEVLLRMGSEVRLTAFAKATAVKEAGHCVRALALDAEACGDLEETLGRLGAIDVDQSIDGVAEARIRSSAHDDNL
jgi:hypothetical protein